MINFIIMILASNFLIFSALYILFNERINNRLDRQDKKLSAFIKSIDPMAPVLKTSEIKIDKKPEHYSPRHDMDTVMSGKVIDPFD